MSHNAQRYQPAHLNFVANFVNSTTVGTFFEDLRRMKVSSHTLRALPRRHFDRIESTYSHQADAA